MASRKEEQQRRRAERLEAEQRESQAARRRLMVGYIVAGALALAIVVGLVIVLASGDGGDGTSSGDFPAEAHIQAQSGSLNGFEPDDREGTEPPAVEQGDLQDAARAAGCDLELDLEIEGNTHIPPDAKEPDYGTSPPNSGDHASTQQADGAYIEQPDDVFSLHSLEHGRINIHYSPDLAEEEQLELKGVFDQEPAGMLFFPNEEMPYEVATTAWGQLMGCDTYEGAATLDAIRAFRETYRGLGPEEVPIVTG